MSVGRSFLTIFLVKGFFISPFWVCELRSQEIARERELSQVEVIAERIVLPTKEADERLHTGYEITQEGVRLFQSRGLLNVWQVLELLPGIFFESTDPTNLAGEQVGIRIRGVRGVLGSMTVLGIPNYGGNPIGPRSYLYDLENFEAIAVYKGAIPENLSTGVGTRGGLAELRPLWPSESSAFKFTATGGNFDYKRIFTRLETGKLPDINTRISLSASYTEAEKWKGPGRVGPRKNLHFQINQPLSSASDLKLLFNLNDQEYHRYRYLTYDEVRALNENRRLDYVDNPSSYLHYDYNRAKHLNRDLMAFLTLFPSSRIRLGLKGYLSSEDASIFEGSSNVTGGPGMQRRVRDIERWGLIPEFSISFGNHTLSAGYHFERNLMEISTENYRINGTSLQYRGLGVVASASPTYTHSPFIQLSGSYGKWTYKLGLKYFYMREEPSEGYVWNMTTMGLQRAPDLDRERKTYDIFLPSLGISYRPHDTWEIYTTYGRTFIRPYAYLPLVTLYNRLRNDFIRAGITLKDLFRGLDIERADNFEIGLRLRTEKLEGNLVFFYSYHDKLLTVISDPRVLEGGKPVSYRQNVGKARGFGLEGNFQYFFGKNNYFFLNPTYQVITYAKDIEFRDITYPVRGKTVVDTPRWIVVSGLNFNIGNLNILPRIKYLGKRFGDLSHREKIGDYLLTDLSLSYRLPKVYSLKDLNISLEIHNLFDKKYVSVISAFDDAVEGTTYGVGAPFTVKLGINFNF